MFKSIEQKPKNYQISHNCKRYIKYIRDVIDKKHENCTRNYSDVDIPKNYNNNNQAIIKLYSIINKQLIDQLRYEGIHIFISGSVAIKSVLKSENIEPHDVDMYIIGKYSPSIIIKFDTIMKEIFKDDIETIIKYQYTLNWKLKNGFIYQLILPETNDIADIFASYHGDLVCIGYDIVDNKFKYAKNRFDIFMETGISYFTDIYLTKQLKNRVANCVDKYIKRGFKCNYESIDDNNLNIQCGILSPMLNNIILINGNVIAEKENLDEDNNNVGATIGKYSNNIHDIYFGEMYKPFLQAFSVCKQCIRCHDLIIMSELNHFCYKCSHINEQTNVLSTNDIINFIDNSEMMRETKFLITGGRCGIGAEIANILFKNNKNVTITTRYPQLTTHQNFIMNKKMNLKDIESVKFICQEIENDMYDVIILNAFETLHYNEEANENQEIEFNGDRKRNETGIWLKTLDNTSDEEIISPVMTNIIGNTMLIRSFLKCVKTSLVNKLLIFVTSFEGTYKEKSPYHPVTNATKSAIEQLIFTIKRQMDCYVGSYIVLADPSWVYTKTSSNLTKGPISITEGACNVLKPLVYYMQNISLENGKIYKCDL